MHDIIIYKLQLIWLTLHCLSYSYRHNFLMKWTSNPAGLQMSNKTFSIIVCLFVLETIAYVFPCFVCRVKKMTEKCGNAKENVVVTSADKHFVVGGSVQLCRGRICFPRSSEFFFGTPFHFRRVMYTTLEGEQKGWRRNVCHFMNSTFLKLNMLQGDVFHQIGTQVKKNG